MRRQKHSYFGRQHYLSFLCLMWKTLVNGLKGGDGGGKRAKLQRTVEKVRKRLVEEEIKLRTRRRR